MNIICLYILIYASSILAGVIAGLTKALQLRKNFPEFFSPSLTETDYDFNEISRNIRTVNTISDEELTIERFLRIEEKKRLVISTGRKFYSERQEKQ